MLCCLVLPASGMAEENAERDAIKGEVAALFAAGDYAALDALSERFVAGERTSSGTWKLNQFDLGLEAAFEHAARDDEHWANIAARIDAWIAAAPDSPAARLAQARSLLARAWSYRGFGFANKVRDEDWAPFKALVEQAREILESNQQRAAGNPLWYQMLTEVAKVQGWGDSAFSKLVNEGLDRHPQFYQLYFNAASRYLPQWGGSFVEYDRFARVAQRRALATDGAGVYARIYWNLYATTHGDRAIRESKVDWDLMCQGIDDVLARYPDQWNINHFAKFACLAEDAELTGALIPRITVLYSPVAWKDMAQLHECQRNAIQGWTLMNLLRTHYYAVVVVLAVVLLLGMAIARRQRAAG